MRSPLTAASGYKPICGDTLQQDPDFFRKLIQGTERKIVSRN